MFLPQIAKVPCAHASSHAVISPAIWYRSAQQTAFVLSVGSHLPMWIVERPALRAALAVVNSVQGSEPSTPMEQVGAGFSPSQVSADQMQSRWFVRPVRIAARVGLQTPAAE
jgi:hypothetical protein